MVFLSKTLTYRGDFLLRSAIFRIVIVLCKNKGNYLMVACLHQPVKLRFNSSNQTHIILVLKTNSQFFIFFILRNGIYHYINMCDSSEKHVVFSYRLCLYWSTEDSLPHGATTIT